MDKQELLKLFLANLGRTHCDARAEVVIAQAVAEDVSFEDLAIWCDSLFHRESGKDIFAAEKEDAAQSPVALHLSRSGLYDQLPEGIFFQSADTDNKIRNAGDMAASYRTNKQTEQGIRRFFQPFEHNFFRFRMQVETEEATMLEGIKAGTLNDYFTAFWGLPDSIPQQFIVPLILLFPYASRIAGNLPLTAQCLQLLLHEKVMLKQAMASPVHTQNLVEQILGKQQCGIDMICGEEFSDGYPVLECTIGPLCNSLVGDYLEYGRYFSLLQTFYQFFVPAEAAVITNIEVQTDKSGMTLETGSGPVLGYSSVLVI